MANQVGYNCENVQTPTQFLVGGEIKVLTGGKLVPNSGTQALTIADQTGAAGVNPTQAEYATLIAAFNALKNACKDLGIIA